MVDRTARLVELRPDAGRNAASPTSWSASAAKGVTQAELNSESGCPLVDPVAEEEAISRLPGVQAVGRGAVLFGVFELNGYSE